MSDCSQEPCCNEASRMRAERDEWQQKARNLRSQYDAAYNRFTNAEVDLVVADEHVRSLVGERDAMRTVVEAAIAVIETDKRLYHGSAEHAEAEAEAAFTALDEAVDAYRNTQTNTAQEETTNSGFQKPETHRTVRHEIQEQTDAT